MMTNKDGLNYGCALLRMLMCFEVVCCHFWESNSYAILSPFFEIRNYAVPVFMFMSFFLSRKLFSSTGDASIGKRIWRLVWPLWGWALIYFIVYRVLGINNVGSVSMLLWQMITGHSAGLNPAMWYQCVLIGLTVLLFVIYRYTSERTAAVISIGLVLLSLFMQYAGYNYALFADLRYEVKYPLGRFVEMIPYAAFGILSMRYLGEKSGQRGAVLIICFVSAIGFALLKKFLPEAPGFQYSGVPKIGIAVSVVSFAYALPFDRLPACAQKVISAILRTPPGKCMLTAGRCACVPAELCTHSA